MADTYQQPPPQQRPTRTGLLILLSRLWMLGLGVVMAIEKTTTAGPRLAAPVGSLLVAAGIAVLLHNPGTGVPGA